jgi:hypothetical protein
MKLQNEANQKEKLMIERKNDQKTFSDMKTKNELFEKKMELLSQEILKL